MFQERQGWERPGWFNPQETAPVSDNAWVLVYVTSRPWASHTLPYPSILPAPKSGQSSVPQFVVTGQSSILRKLSTNLRESCQNQATCKGLAPSLLTVARLPRPTWASIGHQHRPTLWTQWKIPGSKRNQGSSPTPFTHPLECIFGNTSC